MGLGELRDARQAVREPGYLSSKNLMMREGVMLNLERLSSNARAEFYARRLKISSKIVMIVLSDPEDHPIKVALFFLI